MKNNVPFFVVWNVGGGSPTVMHATFDQAEREAQRLARANPGRDFVVLGALVGFKKHDIERTDYADLDSSIPF